MNQVEYLGVRSQRDPRFRLELDAANAELALGEAIVQGWHDQSIALPQLASLTGISQERLEAIEEGDSMSLHEVLWLVHVLDIAVSIGSNFHVTTQTPRLIRRSVG